MLSFLERPKIEARTRVVGSTAELATALTKGTAAVVYDAPKHPYRDAIERLSYALDQALDIVFGQIQGCSTTDHAALDFVAQNAKRPLFMRLSPEDTELLKKVIDSIVEDLKDILDRFPGYSIEGIAVKTGESNVTEKNRKWHQDEDEPTLNIVRTYCGPSTEYAQDEHGTNAQTFAEGSITAHNGQAWHRGPAAVPGRRRFALAIRITPTSKKR